MLNKEMGQILGGLGALILIIGRISLIVIGLNYRKHENISSINNTTQVVNYISKIDIHNKIKVIHTLRKFYPRDFEEFVALIYELKGYTITKRPTYKGKNAKRDGGIDIEAIKDGENYYIQVKKLFTHEVSVNIIREFNGIIMNKKGKGVVVTTSIFSSDAIHEKGNLELVDYRGLLDEIDCLSLENLEILENFINDQSHVNNNFEKKPITCKHCGAPMVKRYWRGRSFYGCMNYYSTHCTNQSDFLI